METVAQGIHLTARAGTARHSRDRFFAGLSLALFCLVAVGFARTYYLRAVYGTDDFPPAMRELPVYLHLHGALLSAWFLLAVAQPVLVASGRVRVHKMMGRVGAGIAVALVVTTVNVLVRVIARSPANGIPSEVLPVVVFGDLFTLVAFSILVIGGVLKRRDREAHGRLMMLASVAMIGPAISRLPGGLTIPALIPGVFLTFLAAVIIHDRMRLRRVHGATKLGVALIVLANAGGVMLGFSAMGRAIIQRFH